ncbi:MAG: 4-hydroxy-tetrahydrodipicolinate reductase [Elusimicrobia bacterium]|nr:4-hydroxy-tetrahydrodipicolinate reductase [Elusimicrobiota bacterium]
MAKKIISIVVCGGLGKMGLKVIEQIKTNSGFSLAGAVDLKESASVKPASAFSGLIKNADVAVDFSAPSASVMFARHCAEARKPVVIGATGFSGAQMEEIKKISVGIAVFLSPNMSPAVNLTFAVSRFMAGKLPDFDIHVTETHHKMKKDSPSGTALKYVICMKSVTDREIPVASIRAGDVVGDHTILFAGPHERVELTHRAHSRDVFAAGALRAAEWIVKQQNGLYDYQDMLGLKNL